MRMLLYLKSGGNKSNFNKQKHEIINEHINQMNELLT